MTLKVWTDGTDWVIAETAKRAHDLRAGSCGETNPDDIGCLGDWRALADDERLVLASEPDDCGTTGTLDFTAAEWVAREGKEGFLCSTEF